MNDIIRLLLSSKIPFVLIFGVLLTVYNAMTKDSLEIHFAPKSKISLILLYKRITVGILIVLFLIFYSLFINYHLKKIPYYNNIIDISYFMWLVTFLYIFFLIIFKKVASLNLQKTKFIVNTNKYINSVMSKKRPLKKFIDFIHKNKSKRKSLFTKGNLPIAVLFINVMTLVLINGDILEKEKIYNLFFNPLGTKQGLHILLIDSFYLYLIYMYFLFFIFSYNKHKQTYKFYFVEKKNEILNGLEFQYALKDDLLVLAYPNVEYKKEIFVYDRSNDRFYKFVKI